MTTPETIAVRRWITLAVSALVLSGLLAALLVVGRTPAFAELLTDPGIFRRFLVVHVDLSLIVWVYAFVAALVFLLPRAGQSSRSSRLGVFVSALGVFALLVAAGAPGARPVLANYVPMIDHWMFAVGLGLFGGGVLLSVCDGRLLPTLDARAGVLPIPAAAVPGLRATAIALLLAALTFAFSWAGATAGLPKDVLFELANWGGGHVLQLASSLAMVSVWLILVSGATNRVPVSRATAGVLFGWMLLPWLAAPLLAAQGLSDVGAREAFTDLMRWAIFPPALVFLVLCARTLIQARRAGELASGDVRAVGFVASAGLCLLGWILGALIRGSTTVIPAHYHAAIGAVTVAFMSVSYPLLEAVGVDVRSSARAFRFAAAQPALFGIGQSVFALGFAIAGSGGMSRKVYGQEQQVEGTLHSLGLFVMGLGGLFAIVSGVLFLALVVAALVRRRQRSRSLAWATGGTHV